MHEVKDKKNNEWDISNSKHHVPYSDADIRLILSFAPLRENCVKMAKYLKRSEGAIIMVYNIASIPEKQVKQTKRHIDNDSFIRQIRRVVKEVKWVGANNVMEHPPKKADKW